MNKNQKEAVTGLAKDVGVSEKQALAALRGIDTAIEQGLREGEEFVQVNGITKDTPVGDTAIREAMIPEVSRLIAKVFAIAFAAEGTDRGAVGTIRSVTEAVFMKRVADQARMLAPVAGAA